jgi:D-arabinose 1-dehydrogenase-like Zn-dependent alcohol dehydrogenase
MTKINGTARIGGGYDACWWFAPQSTSMPKTECVAIGRSQMAGNREVHMRAMVVTKAGAPLSLEERDVPEPAAGQVRLRVHACGVCHGDVAMWQGIFPYKGFATYPRVPGHEVAGVVEAVGDGVSEHAEGDRVGVPWLFDSCGECRSCKRGDGVYCKDTHVTGVTHDGGFQDHMIAPAHSVAKLPDGVSFEDAGPLMCAGLTVFNGLKEGNYRAGDKVAVIGLGGLGHVGVLYAAAMGAQVAVISRHKDKATEAERLGAELFIDSSKDDVVASLQAWGGADVILNTAPSAKVVTQAFPGLAQRGTCVVLGASPEMIEVKPGALLNGNRKLTGSTTGGPEDIRRALEFAAHNGIHPSLTRFGLDDAQAALEAHLNGTLTGRAVVLTE